MSIATETFWNGPSTGTGSLATFGFTFPVSAASEVVVLVDGVAVGNYTVVFTDPTNTLGGGNVVFDTNYEPAAGTSVLRVRRKEYLQSLDVTPQGSYSAAAVEAAFDNLTMQIQQIAKRSLLIADVALGDGWDGELPDPDAANAGDALILNTAKDAMIFGAPASVAVSSAMQPVVSAASLSAARAAMSVPGLTSPNTFTGADDATSPLIALKHTGASSTEKIWAHVVNLAGQCVLGSYTDAGVFANTAWRAVRSGTSISSVDFGATVRPIVDDSYDVGSASFRFDDVYATNTTIQTSDAREKTELQPLPDSVKRAARALRSSIGFFQWNSSVAEKGDAARLHVGVTAQAVRDAFTAEGEDPERWGVFCCDDLEEAYETEETVRVADADGERDVRVIVQRTRPKRDANGVQETRLGVRYDQLLLLMLAALEV